MDNREAKAWIEANWFDGDAHGFVNGDEEHMAMYRALQALDLQIPEKPMADTVDGIHVIPVCPSCGMALEESERRCECGKRIDWSVDHLHI